MDKYEYKVRADEIKKLVEAKQYTEAMKVADTIDWQRVKSVMMLTIVSDIYKVNRRYDDSKEALLLAYARHPEGRTIVYSLCELSIKMEEFVQAVEYYKEFVQIAPKDTGRYILQYKLYEAQEVSLEERISVLEEFKKRDYREKWAYELAYLYHRIGLSTRCVEECDELALWFGDGKYVLKSMELKMLHEPLNPLQQVKYDKLSGNKNAAPYYEEEQDIDDDEMDIEVKTMDMGKYNTINLQKELAESMRELMLDGGEAAELVKYKGTQPVKVEEVFFEEGKTGELPAEQLFEESIEADTEEDSDGYYLEEEDFEEDQEEYFEEAEIEESKIEEAKVEESKVEESVKKESVKKKIVAFPTDAEIKEKNEFDRMLAQEYDGQISLVVPEREQLEKQITGQMKITDILAEWEQTKKQNQEKRSADVRRKVLEQTGQLFSEFDEATKTDLLAKLEQASKLEEENRLLKEAVLKKQTDISGNVIAEEIVESVIAPEEEPDMSASVPEEEAGTPPIAPNEADDTMIALAEESEKPQELPLAEENKAPDTGGGTETNEEPNEEDADKARTLTEEEETLFSTLLHSKKAKRELLATLEAVSLDSSTGNVIIAGEVGTGTVDLAKNLIRDVQMIDNNFSGKVAKVTGAALNSKNVAATLGKLENGALIIEKASDMTINTIDKMTKVLDQNNKGILVILEDTPSDMDKFLNNHKKIEKSFNARINVPQLNNDALVTYAREYALEEEYTVDELGVLALYTRIAELQTSDHAVTVADVEEIVEDAIYHANKKTIPHFMDILFAKRYDDEDMIILRENDFINY